MQRMNDERDDAPAVPESMDDTANDPDNGSLPLDERFDTEFADEIARLESYNKHHYRPNSYLHKWWARRCGSTFRLILKHLVRDEARRDYYAPGGLAGKIILDPMMGGGTTLHEAIRLGANVIGVDIDPIPVLQARATLSHVSLLSLEMAYKTFYQRLQKELAPFFVTACPLCGVETSLRFVLYGLRRFGEDGAALIVDSTVLRQESNGTVIHICPRCHAIVYNDEPCRCPAPDAYEPIIEKGEAAAKRYRDDLKVPYYARYEPLVIAGRCGQHKLFFKAPDTADRARIQQANDRRRALSFVRQNFAIEPGRKSIQLVRRGIDNYLHLFSSRQLLYLQQAIALLPRFDDPLVRLNLALLVSTSLEFNAMLCGYKGKSKRRAGAIRHTFSYHAYSFPYTALENNPVYPRMRSGTLQKLFHARIRRGRSWAQKPRERKVNRREKPLFVEIAEEVDMGTAVESVAQLGSGSRRFYLCQGTSTALALADDSVDYIVTDPPYFDSVQYSDLSAFFRVWLRQLLPGEADWTYDVDGSAVDPHGNDKESRYAEIIGRIFKECHRVLRKENGRFIFTFHHWNPKGWAALTLALKHARFVLVNRYVVHSENPTSVHIANMKSLTHDAILVLAPTKAGIRNGWQQPSGVDQNDSYQFCLDCATLLGWMLNAGLADSEIQQQWQQAIS